jgi:antitoxin VbhA-like protein
MTVSQFEQDVLWEPLSPAEAVADAIASMRVDGLELDEFGLALMQRIADEEIDEDEAIAILLAHYGK